jgi:hypothetical protein
MKIVAGLGIVDTATGDLVAHLRSLRFAEFLASLDVEALPSPQQLDEKVRVETRWWGEPLSPKLLQLVSDGRHAEPDRSNGFDRSALCRRLGIPDGQKLAASGVDAALLIASANLAVEEGLDVAELDVTSGGSAIADIIRLADSSNVILVSSDTDVLRNAWAAWAGVSAPASFEADQNRWRSRLRRSPWLANGFLLGHFVEAVQRGREAVVEHVEPWLGWLQQGLLDGEDELPTFVGRKAFAATLDTELADSREKFVVVSAGAGNGKTAFLRHVARDRHWPLLLCRLNPDPVDLQRLLAASAAAVGVADALDPKLVSGPPSLAVPQLIDRLSVAHTDREQFVLLLDDVDALATAEPIHSLFLPESLPEHVRVVCSTTNPRLLCAQVGSADSLALDTADENSKDLEAFVRARLLRAGASVEDVQVEVFLSKLHAESATWLYARLVLDDVVRDGWDAVASLPANLTAYYSREWASSRDHLGIDFWIRTAVPTLSVLLAAREPLRFSEIEEFIGAAAGVVEELATHAWSKWLAVHDGRVSWRAETHRTVICSAPAPFGSSLSAATKAASEQLVDRSLGFIASGSDAWWARYGLRHAVGHLLALGDVARARELVVVGAQEWIEAHASVDSGSTYSVDLKQLFDVAAAAAHPDFGELGTLLRIRAQLGDNIDGTSVALLAPAVAAGMLSSAQLALLVETDSDRGHASWVQLLRFSTSDAADADLDAAVQALHWRAEFFGAVIAFAPKRVVERLVARWWADADGGEVPSRTVMYQGGVRLPPRMTRASLTEVLSLWPVLNPVWHVRVPMLLDAVYHELGAEPATRAAHVLLTYVPWHGLSDPAVMESIGRHLPAERIDAELADRARMLEAFERRWRAQKGLIDLVAQVRLFGRSNYPQEQLSYLRESSEMLGRAASAAGLFPRAFALEVFLAGLVGGDEERSTIERVGERGVIYRYTPGFDHVVEDLQEALDSWGVQRRAGEMWPYPGSYNDSRDDLLPLFLGGLDAATRREVAHAVVRTLDGVAPTWSDIETDDWILRSRYLVQVLDEVDDSEAVIDLVLRSASEQTSTQMRRAILAPFAGRLAGIRLGEAIRISVSADVPTSGDVAALELISRGQHEREHIVDWPNISATVRVRAWLAGSLPAGEKLMMVAKWWPDDLGRADFESIRRMLDRAIDPGGFHRDVTSGISGSLEFGVLATVAKVEQVVAECTVDQVERAARHALDVGKLRVAHEILTSDARIAAGHRSPDLWSDLAVARLANNQFGDALPHLQEMLRDHRTFPAQLRAAVQEAVVREDCESSVCDPERALFWLTVSTADLSEESWSRAAARQFDAMRAFPQTWTHELVGAALVWHLKSERPVPEWLWRESSRPRVDESDWNRSVYLTLEPWIESAELAARVRTCISSALESLLASQVSLMALPLVEAQLLAWDDLVASRPISEEDRERAKQELLANSGLKWQSDAMTHFVRSWLHSQASEVLHGAEATSGYFDNTFFLLWLAVAVSLYGAELVWSGFGSLVPPTLLDEAVMRAAVTLKLVAAANQDLHAREPDDAVENEDGQVARLSPADFDGAWKAAARGLSGLLHSDSAVVAACRSCDPAVWWRPSELASIRTVGGVQQSLS